MTPCPSTNVAFASSCGFKNFTTTCRNVSGHTIASFTSETCDATMVLGDGTTHNAHLIFTERPPACPGCNHQQIAVTIDGQGPVNSSLVNFGSDTPFGPATCSSDAGIEDSGPTDSSLDSSADTSG